MEYKQPNEREGNSAPSANLFLPVLIVYILTLAISNFLFPQSSTVISSVSSGIFYFFWIPTISIALFNTVPLLVGATVQFFRKRKSIPLGLLGNFIALAVLILVSFLFQANSEGRGYFLLGLLFGTSWYVLGGLILYYFLQIFGKKILYILTILSIIFLGVILVKQIQEIKLTISEGGSLPEVYKNLDVNEDINRSLKYFDEKVSYCKTFSSEDAKKLCVFKLYDDVLIESFKPGVNLETLISQSSLDFLCENRRGDQNGYLCTQPLKSSNNERQNQLGIETKIKAINNINEMTGYCQQLVEESSKKYCTKIVYLELFDFPSQPKGRTYQTAITKSNLKYLCDMIKTEPNVNKQFCE